MTNDRAVEVLNAIIFLLDRDAYSDEVETAIHMAINALTAQEQLANHSPELDNKFGDLISRSAAQTELMMKCERYTLARESHVMGHVEWSDELIDLSDAMDAIRDLPSVQPETHEKRTETHSCDLISRKMAIDVIRKWKSYETTEGLVVRINNLPSALQRTGRWIDHVEDGYVECPFCHSATNCDDNISDLHFCFSCGARMEGE